MRRLRADWVNLTLRTIHPLCQTQTSPATFPTGDAEQPVEERRFAVQYSNKDEIIAS